jgi:hypothetical protein
MQTLFYAFLIYIAVMFAVVYFKPKTMYNHETNEHRSFGTGGNATFFPTWLCASVVAIFSYLVALLLSSPNYTILLPPSEPNNTTNTILQPPIRRASIGGSTHPHHHQQKPQNQQNPLRQPQQQPYLQDQHHPYHPHHQHTHGGAMMHFPHHNHPIQPLYHQQRYPHTHAIQPEHVQNSRVWKRAMR